jgi:hypothetical protein
MYVVTADQRHSRSGPDLVPATLDTLGRAVGHSAVRPLERTVGDEIQGIFADPDAVLTTVLLLLRPATWHVGVGVGEVDTPLPASTRSARGAAFIAAREAVEAARTGVHHVAVRAGRYAAVEGPEHPHAHFAESALVLMARIRTQRTVRGWEVTDMLDSGMSQGDTARALGVSPAAVSQRVRAAGWHEDGRGLALARHHLVLADVGATTPDPAAPLGPS